jgi:D-tyrosyl-tRNA(Tyr) deacylase
MRAVVQRVERASVTVDGDIVGRIGQGLAVLVGVEDTDTSEDAETLAAKMTALRIFADENGRMNRSVVEVGGSVLVVSQFTLLADVRKGRRPSFTAAAPPDRAQPLVEAVCAAVREQGIDVAEGRFGAMMSVELVNDGPVTILVETDGGRVV